MLRAALIVVGGVVLDRILFEPSKLVMKFLHFFPRALSLLRQAVAPVHSLPMLSGQHSYRIFFLLEYCSVLLSQSLNDLRVTLVPFSNVLLQLGLQARNPLQQTRLLHHEAVSLHRGFSLSLARLRSHRTYLPFTLLAQLRVPLMILNNGAHGIVLSIPREELVLTPVKRLSQQSKLLVFCVEFSLEVLFLGCKLGDFCLEKVDFVGGLLAEV